MSQSPSQEKIVFYSKSSCPWARAVRHVLDQAGLEYEERPINLDHAFYEALERETGQVQQPTLKIGDTWLIDTDAKAVAKHLNLPAPSAVQRPA
jgi:glutaredoxin